MSTTVDPTIRPVRPAEHEAVGALVLTAYDAVGTMSPAYRRQLADTAGRIDDETTVLVAVAGTDPASGMQEDGAETLLGTVTVTTARSAHFEHAGHGDGGIRMLAVAPDRQGRGIGSHLVEHVVAHGRRQGWRRLALTTMAWMHDAQRLYEGLGFVRRPDLDVRYPTGVGHAYTLDLVQDAASAFPLPEPGPVDPPWFEDVAAERRGCC